MFNRKCYCYPTGGTDRFCEWKDIKKEREVCKPFKGTTIEDGISTFTKIQSFKEIREELREAVKADRMFERNFTRTDSSERGPLERDSFLRREEFDMRQPDDDESYDGGSGMFDVNYT